MVNSTARGVPRTQELTCHQDSGKIALIESITWELATKPSYVRSGTLWLEVGSVFIGVSENGIGFVPQLALAGSLHPRARLLKSARATIPCDANESYCLEQRAHPYRGRIRDPGSRWSRVRTRWTHRNLPLPLRSIGQQAVLRRVPRAHWLQRSRGCPRPSAA